MEKEYKSELIGFRTTPHLANRLKTYCQDQNITISAFFSNILENLENSPEILKNEITLLKLTLEKKERRLQKINDQIQEEKENLKKHAEQAEKAEKQKQLLAEKAKKEQQQRERLHKEFFRIIDILRKNPRDSWDDISIKESNNNPKLLILVKQWINKEKGDKNERI